MYFCTCQYPWMHGGMMMPSPSMNNGMMMPGQGGMQAMPDTPSMQMTPTVAQGQGTGQRGVAGQMEMSEPNGQLPMEQSFIENILRLNRGKVASVYMTFEGEEQREFRGVIEAAGRDHIVLSDSETGERYLLLMVYLDYVKFDEEIEYSYPIGRLATYSPR